LPRVAGELRPAATELVHALLPACSRGRGPRARRLRDDRAPLPRLVPELAAVTRDTPGGARDAGAARNPPGGPRILSPYHAAGVRRPGAARHHAASDGRAPP